VYLVIAAFFTGWLVPYHIVLFDSLFTTDLASRSGLQPYDTSTIDIVWLAASGCPDCLAARGLGNFHTMLGQTLRFHNAHWN
jgi:hypothetical protein